MISNEQLDEWESLANQATEGPWLKWEEAKAKYKECAYSFDWWQIIALNKATKMPFVLCSSNGCLTPKEEIKKSWRTGKEPEGQTKKDLAFIIAAREAVPALIALVRELQGELRLLNKEAAWLAAWAPHCHRTQPLIDTCSGGEDRAECINCWRIVAQKAVQK